MSENADFNFRHYDHKKDSRAVLEAFKEVGWMERDSDRQTDAAMLAYLKSARSWVAEIGGRAESLACTGPGQPPKPSPMPPKKVLRLRAWGYSNRASTSCCPSQRASGINSIW